MQKVTFKTKKGDFDDLVENYRDAYYDLLENVVQFMNDAQEGHYGDDDDIVDEILYRMSVNIESSLRATPPKDLA